jgi:hypothetical protein
MVKYWWLLIITYYWDHEKSIFKYTLEPVGKHVLYPKMETFIRTDKYEHKIQEFNITQDVEGNYFTLMLPIHHG